jgi:hypothetical protein
LRRRRPGSPLFRHADADAAGFDAEPRRWLSFVFLMLRRLLPLIAAAFDSFASLLIFF